MTNWTIVEPGFELLTPIPWLIEYPELLEYFGRTCYKSENQITTHSAKGFVKRLIKSGHLSVLEHLSITVKITGDRSMSHQLVRHRIAAYSQESQRYCNYSKKGFQIIRPITVADDADKTDIWLDAVGEALVRYEELIDSGVPPEDARSVLPNAIKTEVVTTFNLRQWRHVFEHRALNPKAQWQIRQIMQDILRMFVEYLPCIFEDQFI